MKKEKTILTFITSIRHPDNSHDYNRVWDLLRNTLRSVCAQTNKNFKVVVVTNKILDDFKNDSQIKNLEFVEVDFKAPGPKGVVRTGMSAIRLDRSTKYVRGLIHAEKYNSKYTMFFDADDFLSNKLVEHISNNDPLCFNSGWIIKDGFVTNLKNIVPRSDKRSFCGSNIIFNTKLLRSEINFSILNNSSTQDEIKKSTNDFYLSKVIGSHLFSRVYFEKTKPRFLEIPFRGTIYYVGTGENHQKTNQEKLFFRKGKKIPPRPITNNIIEEFKLPLKTKLPEGDDNL